MNRVWDSLEMLILFGKWLLNFMKQYYKIITLNHQIKLYTYNKSKKNTDIYVDQALNRYRNIDLDEYE